MLGGMADTSASGIEGVERPDAPRRWILVAGRDDPPDSARRQGPGMVVPDPVTP